MPNLNLRGFFKDLEALRMKASYRMVHMYTCESDVLPAEVNLRSRFSRRIPLNLPVAAAAMDTTSEAPMAITLAEAGAICSIHKNMLPTEQAKHVARVRHRMQGLVKTPHTVHCDMTVGEHLANQRMRREARKTLFDKFPVLENAASNKLVGVITDNDLDFCIDQSQKIGEIMVPIALVEHAASSTKIEEAYKRMLSTKKKLLPLVGNNGDLAGMYLFRDAKRICSGINTAHNLDQHGRLIVCAAVGVGDKAMLRAELLAAEGCNVFHIDTAHGDSSRVFETIRRLKTAYPDIDVVAGNISRGEAAKRLVEAGADGILVGQGPGAICTTRLIAGVGVPQVSAIFDCVQAVEGTDVPIIADGGIEYSGDAAIALALGASCVMVGRFLAGTDEAPGDTFLFKGRMVKGYRGMGSLGALQESDSSRERYLHGGDAFVPEGIEGHVEYQGSVKGVLDQLVGGIRKSMGYLGAKNLAEFAERAELFLVPNSSESHPHGVTITKEAPNYRPPA